MLLHNFIVCPLAVQSVCSKEHSLSTIFPTQQKKFTSADERVVAKPYLSSHLGKHNFTGKPTSIVEITYTLLLVCLVVIGRSTSMSFLEFNGLERNQPKDEIFTSLGLRYMISRI